MVSERKGILSDSLKKTENGLGALFIIALALLPFAEMVTRLIASGGIDNYDTIVRHLTLWTALICGMITSREDQHIRLTAFGEQLGPRWGGLVKTVSAVSGMGVAIGFAVSALSFSLVAFDPADRLLGLPFSVIGMVMPVSFAIIAVRFVTVPAGLRRRPLWLLAGLLLGFFLSLPPLVNLLYLWVPELPLFWDDWVTAYYDLFSYLDWPLLVVMIGLTFLGAPIFLLLGGTAYFFFSGSWGALEVIPNEAYNLLTDISIPAIPLFTLTGFILSEGGTGKRLVRLFKSLLGKVPGGLAIMAVLVCAFFTTFTGASGVTILALGGLLSYILIKSHRYSSSFTRGLITASGSIGLLFPPSLPIIMYGVTAQISIKEMFLAGIIPGFILVLALSLMGVRHALKRGWEPEPFDPKELAAALRAALGDLLLPVVILVLYFGGVTTLVETGAVAVVYSLLMEVVIRREIRGRELGRLFARSLPVIGGVLIILAMAKGLSYYIVDAQVPLYLTAFFRENVTSPFVFLILLNLVLLVTGCLMDIFSAILVVAPLIIPLGELYQIHPVQLGIIFLANLQLGYLTPPVGLNLFLASYAFEAPLSKVYRSVIPFFFVLLLMVLLITYVPWFSLALLGGG